MRGGIYGAVGAVASDALAAMSMRLSHRGQYEQSIVCDGPVHLAWRGSRADAAAEAAQGVPLVFSGTLFNRTELAALLGRPVECSPAFDRQLIWELYCRFGVEAFARLNGPFTIALVEPGSRSLVLAVDRWAARPLHFAQTRGGWLFASESKAVIDATPEHCEIDRTVAGYLAATKYLPLQRTLAAHIQCLGPGQYARLRQDQCEIGRYATLEVQSQCADERVCAAELEECLLAAARRVVTGHDRIGLGLSGGLDSVLTLGAVRKVAPQVRIHTYTGAFDREDPVLRKARQAADYFGTVHHEIVIPSEELPELLTEMVWRMEDPVAREEMLVYCVLAQQAARDVPLVLYGHMADILFAGMPRHRLLKLASDLPFVRSPLMQFYEYTQSGETPPNLLGKLLVAAYFRGHLNDPPKVLGAGSLGDGKHVELTGDDPLNNALALSTWQPTELGAMERLHAWAGVELASIFHDGDVAQCAFKIGSDLKIRGRSRKHILRLAARTILPQEFAQRPKDLIRIKRDDRLRRAIKAMSDEVLSPAAVRARGLFDPEEVARLCATVADRECPQQAFCHLWTLLLIELWCRTFIDGTPQPYRYRFAKAAGYEFDSVLTACRPGQRDSGPAREATMSGATLGTRAPSR